LYLIIYARASKRSHTGLLDSTKTYSYKNCNTKITNLVLSTTLGYYFQCTVPTVNPKLFADLKVHEINFSVDNDNSLMDNA
jgi:hypothetical protein